MPYQDGSRRSAESAGRRRVTEPPARGTVDASGRRTPPSSRRTLENDVRRTQPPARAPIEGSRQRAATQPPAQAPIDSYGQRAATQPPARAPIEGYGQRPATRPPARRTVTIRGQVADRRSPRMVEVDRRRPPRRARDRAMNRPDRVALWAVLLCLLLLAGAVASSHAATLTHRSGAWHAPATAIARPR